MIEIQKITRQQLFVLMQVSDDLAKQVKTIASDLSCRACVNFQDHTGHCSHYGAGVPPEAQAAGCDDGWQFDYIPF